MNKLSKTELAALVNMMVGQSACLCEELELSVQSGRGEPCTSATSQSAGLRVTGWNDQAEPAKRIAQ